MSLLKLLFFVGVSVTMMVSVLAIVDSDDESPRVPMKSGGIMNDEDNNEYSDENAILFDEVATTIPPPDMLHDIEYDEDINEDYAKDAIIFDEPATTIPPPDMLHDVEYDEDVNEDYEKDAIIFDEPATTIPPPDMLHDIAYDEDVNEDYEKDAVIFDEPAVKRKFLRKIPHLSKFAKNFEKIFEEGFGYKVSDFIAGIDKYKKDYLAKMKENKKA